MIVHFVYVIKMNTLINLIVCEMYEICKYSLLWIYPSCFPVVLC